MKTIADIRNMTGTEIANMLAYMAGQNDKIESLQGERTLAWNEFETEYRKQDKRIEHLESAIAESCDDMRSEFLRTCPIADRLQGEIAQRDKVIERVRGLSRYKAVKTNPVYINGKRPENYPLVEMVKHTEGAFIIADDLKKALENSNE